MNIQARLIHELKRDGRGGALLACGAAIAAAGGLLVLQQAGFIASILDRVIFSGDPITGLSPQFAGLAAVVLARALLTGFGESLTGLGALKIKMSLRQLLFTKINRLGPAFASSRDSGQISAALTDGVDAIEIYFSQYLPQAALAAIIPLGIFLFVLPLDTLTGVILFFTAPLIPLFMVLIGRNAEKLTRRQWTALGRMSAFFLDTLQGLQELKLLGRSRERGEKLRQVSETYRETTLEVMRLTFLSALALEWVATLSTAVIAVQVGLRLLAGGLPFEQAFFILVIAPDFYAPLRSLGLRFHAGMAGISAARTVYEILKEKTPITSGSVSPQVWKTSDRIEIEFSGVSFNYPGRDKPALREISLCLEPGKLHALAGRNGSGKSTLAALLLRFIVPDSGRIRVNGQPMEEIPLEGWRGAAAWVPQRPYLFHASLADNIRLGRPDAGMKEVEKAAALARMEKMVAGMPRGFETIIGDKGARLSGGQARRLAIARAFLMDRPLLIMDEPSADLDLELELDLHDVIKALAGGRTTMLIAHRLTSLKAADRVFFLEEGRLAEEGPFTELLRRKGRLYELINNSDHNLDFPQAWARGVRE